MSRRRVLLFGLCSVAVAAACAGAPPPPSQKSPLLHRVMPAFEGVTLSRNHFYTAQGTEHPMVVHFFSSNGRGSRRASSVVQRVYEGDSELLVVGISEDASAAEARQNVDELGIHFPVILDEGGRISKLYGVSDVPVTFVITQRGSVIWVGASDESEEGVRAAVRVARR